MIKSRRMIWAGHVAQMGEKRKAYRLFVGRARRRCVDNIRMDLAEIGWSGVDWIGLAQDKDN
jgi:DeoR/GlpR family transcriptional regulator of sugar metabolism